MKKLFTTAISLLLGCSMTACGPASAPASTETTSAPPLLRAGYAQVDITPKESVPMNVGGEGKDGMSLGVLDYLYATCVYLVDDAGTELYLMAFDLCNMYPPLPDYRLELAKKLGIPENRLMFSASHTHSSVNIKATKIPSTSKYIISLKESLEQAALSAKADAKAVSGMYHTAAETESLNFVRRYVMVDGSYAGDNYGNHSLGYAGHETEGDHQLQLLKFTREGGKDIILTNFQTHPHRTAYYDTKNNAYLSADIVGAYRQELAQRLDCHALYYTGSSGNVNAHSRIQEENVHATYKDHAKAMVDYAEAAAANFTPLDLGQIKLTKTLYVGNVNHTEDHLLPEAKIVADRFNSGMGNSASLEGYKDIFVHSRHALSVVSHAAMSETLEVPLYAFSIGGFSACYAPFELFAELGIQIKDGSPFDATFVCCYSNYIFSYMPTQLAFDHGGYGAYKCNFEPGTGEIIADTFISQLNTLHQSN